MIKTGFRHFNAGYLFFALAAIGSVMALVLPSITASLERAEESEARITLGSIKTSLEAFHREFRTYTDNLEKIGFSPQESQRFHYYLSASKIPDEIRSLLQESELPFTSKDNYRILAVIKSRDRLKIIICEKEDCRTRKL
ncbi:hypothetical protein QJS83_14300 [Bdellovibrio sp. 22V]|uniref:hypothetical protein n=1 Tax=Bdellovibrio TaxID=958 RepID=UPI0025438FAB|nr:hypothetical protein [Bdellovibrio sp. 22V]WII71637.1 hypothetical protein QJS83_14300 [Bdellovibrio sp. 22V]